MPAAGTSLTGALLQQTFRVDRRWVPGVLLGIRSEVGTAMTANATDEQLLHIRQPQAPWANSRGQSQPNESNCRRLAIHKVC
jgi:hypothetical protein